MALGLYYIAMTLGWGYALMGLVLWDWRITASASACFFVAAVLAIRVRSRRRYWAQRGQGLHSHCGGGDGK